LDAALNLGNSSFLHKPSLAPARVTSLEREQIEVDEVNEVYRLILTSLRATYGQLYEEHRLSSHALHVLCDAVDFARDGIKGAMNSDMHQKTERPFKVLWEKVYAEIVYEEKSLACRDKCCTDLGKNCCMGRAGKGAVGNRCVENIVMRHRYHHIYHKVELLHGLVRGMQIVTKAYFSDAEYHGADHVQNMTAHDMMLERHGNFVEIDKLQKSGVNIEDEIDNDIIRKAKKQLILMANDHERTMELIHTVRSGGEVGEKWGRSGGGGWGGGEGEPCTRVYTDTVYLEG
jgi:hypothetical protein